jgi:hypothetical protein
VKRWREGGGLRMLGHVKSREKQGHCRGALEPWARGSQMTLGHLGLGSGLACGSGHAVL